MSKAVHTSQGYRYPGTRPFCDNEVDRCLFFGREQENEFFLYKVLANQLVVLFSGSGIGKTSLINVCLKQELRDRGFFPLMIRLNDPDYGPIQVIYQGIKEIVEKEHLDYEAGNENTLWQYFKSIAFWSPDNKLQTPVLILDQFEEFFNVYLPETRLSFTKHLADIINNNIPEEVLKAHNPGEPFPYSDRPPNLKIVISIREDYLGYLEEMSDYIPGIFDNRYRLLPLNIKNARKAINEPSRVNHELIKSKSFVFTPEALDMMLDFLCRQVQGNKIKNKDEIESYHLQFLCKHIEENKVSEKKSIGKDDLIIKPEDIGGEQGMHMVLQQFYEGMMEKFSPGKNRGLNFQ